MRFFLSFIPFILLLSSLSLSLPSISPSSQSLFNPSSSSSPSYSPFTLSPLPSTPLLFSISRTSPLNPNDITTLSYDVLPHPNVYVLNSINAGFKTLACEDNEMKWEFRAQEERYSVMSAEGLFDDNDGEDDGQKNYHWDGEVPAGSFIIIDTQSSTSPSPHPSSSCSTAHGPIVIRKLLSPLSLGNSVRPLSSSSPSPIISTSSSTVDYKDLFVRGNISFQSTNALNMHPDRLINPLEDFVSGTYQKYTTNQAKKREFMTMSAVLNEVNVDGGTPSPVMAGDPAKSANGGRWDSWESEKFKMNLANLNTKFDSAIDSLKHAHGNPNDGQDANNNNADGGIPGDGTKNSAFDQSIYADAAGNTVTDTSGDSTVQVTPNSNNGGGPPTNSASLIDKAKTFPSSGEPVTSPPIQEDSAWTPNRRAIRLPDTGLKLAHIGGADISLTLPHGALNAAMFTGFGWNFNAGTARAIVRDIPLFQYPKDNPIFSLDCMDCYMGISIGIRVDITWDMHNEGANSASVVGTLTVPARFALRASVTAGKDLEFQHGLGTIPLLRGVLLFSIGPIPIILGANLGLSVVGKLSAQASVAVQAGYEASFTISRGIRIAGGATQSLKQNGKFTHSVIMPTVEASATVDAQFGIQISLGMTIDAVTSLTLNVLPHVEIQGTVAHSADQQCALTPAPAKLPKATVQATGSAIVSTSITAAIIDINWEFFHFHGPHFDYNFLDIGPFNLFTRCWAVPEHWEIPWKKLRGTAHEAISSEGYDGISTAIIPSAKEEGVHRRAMKPVKV